MTIPWNEILFVGKWLLIALFYLALLIVFLAVRREMRSFRRDAGSGLKAAAGRLRVVSSEADASFKRGDVLALPNEVLVGSNSDQIGRDGILLRDPYVSSRHARLYWDGASWWLEDLGSTNGSVVDRQPCPAHEAVPVPFGGAIQLGGMTFRLEE